MKHFSFLFILLLSTSNFSYSQDVIKNHLLDEIVVTANRLETVYKEIAGSVTVINSKELSLKKQKFVLDILKSVPGLDIVQLGGPGSQTSAFMRGASSNHILVMIDGVEINDPSSPGRAFDLSTLTADNVERIEVLRGPQSTLYGSDAVAGLINIITKKGSGDAKYSFSTESGKYSTLNYNFSLSGGVENFYYSVMGSRSKTDGISSASEALGNTEKDGNKNLSLSSKIGYNFTNLNIESVFRFIDNETDIDNGGGIGFDDPNNILNTKKVYFRTHAKSNFFRSNFEQKFGVSYSDASKDNTNGIDEMNPTSAYVSSSDGSILKFDFQNSIDHKNGDLIFGFEAENETASSVRTGEWPSIFEERDAATTGFYLQEKLSLNGRFFATFGGRIENNKKFGTHTTFKVEPAFFINTTSTKLKASYGTGFKAPSLYQLYSAYGSEDLKPDESTGFDIGIEQFLFDAKVMIGVTYFNIDYKNLIDFDGNTFLYNNIGEAESKGFEFYSVLSDIGKFNIKTGYTFTDAPQKSTGDQLIRRPKHKFNLDVNYGLSEKLNGIVSFIYTGERFDNDFATWPATRVSLDGFLLVNLSSEYNINNSFSIFGKIDNLLDKDYQPALGYGSFGIYPSIGFRLSN